MVVVVRVTFGGAFRQLLVSFEPTLGAEDRVLRRLRRALKRGVQTGAKYRKHSIYYDVYSAAKGSNMA